jgi:hypothetical protein
MSKPKFKPLKSRFRATFAGNQLEVHFGQIDTENEVLHDVQITLEGEAKGHGVWLDRQFCEDVAAAGNATGDVGLKVRYGHPAMCSDAIGTELGRAKNFRVVDLNRTVDGETVKAAGVVADVYLLKSAHAAPQGDIAKHVLETAKEDPGQFGQSIVFTYADWKVKDADGSDHSYIEECECDDETKRKSFDDWFGQSADGKVYAVLGKLHGSDFTDTPAATDGVFSTGTLAEEADQMLDEHPQILEVLEKNPKALSEFLERTGLFDKIESARVAGLQAAKDKQLAELKTAHDAELAALQTSMAELRSVNEQLTADIGAKDAALAEANALVEQLRSKHAEAEKALAEKQAALEVAETRYREQVGLALKPSEQFAGLHGRDLAIAALKSRT